MHRTIYDKLVRDLIPDIIRREGHTCGIEMFDDDDFRHALRQKLVEEASEAAAATTPVELLTELADLQEVVDVLLAAHGQTRETLVGIQHQRRLERGAFERRLRLLWTE